MKLKAFVNLGFLILLIAIPFRVTAKSPDVELQPRGYAAIGVTDNKAVFSFGELGYRVTELISPFATTRVRFSMPPGWKLLPGGEIELHYDVLISGADANKIVNNKNPYGGYLVLTLNDITVGTLPLDQIGNNKVRVKIPPEALVSAEKDGSHLLAISLSAQFTCLSNINAIVTINPTSLFDLPLEVSNPGLNLSNLPAPFYLNNSFIPDSTLIVLPDNPDALETQAALDVMAGFGSMVGGVYNIKLITNSQLSEADITSNHMIFVGMPGQLGVLSDVKFSVPIVNGQFVNLPPESAEDGVIQLALSPWNSNKAVMMVSGNSGVAVVKAAQAVSSGSVFVYENPTIAYVSSIQSLSETIPVVENFSLQNLGYVTTTLSGIGVFSTEYSFNVSQEQVTAKDGYIDLVYYHSGSLNYGSSSMSVDLNRLVVTSVVFSKESEQATILRIKIPSGTLRFGENLLRVTASMPSTQSCDSSELSNPWLIISDQSMFHLSATTDGTPSNPLLVDLSFLPDLFTTHSDLGDVVFVLPTSSPVSLKIAGDLAYSLGDAANPRISNLMAAYADDVPQDIRDTQSMIVIGRSSTLLPFLAEFNDALPAPFDFNTDTASESQMQIVYRIPVGVSVGYLELIPSPFNTDKSILVVSGNSDNGLVFTGNALVQSELARQLAGTFAVTNETQVATGIGSSLSSIVGLVVPGAEVVVTTPIPTTPSETPFASTPPAWLMPILSVSGLIIVVVMGLVIRSAIVRNRVQGFEKPGDEDANSDASEDNPDNKG